MPRVQYSLGHLEGDAVLLDLEVHVLAGGAVDRDDCLDFRVPGGDDVDQGGPEGDALDPEEFSSIWLGQKPGDRFLEVFQVDVLQFAYEVFILEEGEAENDESLAG